MKSQLTLIAAVFFGAIGGSLLPKIISNPAKAGFDHKRDVHCHVVNLRISGRPERNYYITALSGAPQRRRDCEGNRGIIIIDD